MKYKLTVYDTDCTVTYEFDDVRDIIEQLKSIENAEKEEAKKEESCIRPLTPYERTRASVYASGNKWAIENFNATH